MPSLEPMTVPTSRLTTHVWAGGPQDGRPVLLVHGNLVSGGWWRDVAALLPDDTRVLAPDLRGFGRTESRPVDATRGLGDLCDDLHALLQAVGWAGRDDVVAAGWSMGGGVLQQHLLLHPGDLAGVVLVAPLSPYGFGGTKGEHGEPCTDDAAGTGGGGASPAFVDSVRSGDRGGDDPNSARAVHRAFFGAGDRADEVDEDLLVDEMLRVALGEDHYPGDSTSSPHWPGFAPGTRGILNAMSPRWYDASGIVDAEPKPPVTWVHGTADQVVGDASMFDLATLGQMGAVPGWPGEDVMPPQPMAAQTRAVLRRYAANGGTTREVPLDGVGHGIPVAAPQAVADEIAALLR